MAYSDGGYTTNLPLEDVTGGKAWVVFAYAGQPLAPEHGGPARMLVPQHYFWKSAKWVRASCSSRPTSPASGRQTATTITETHGRNSATRETDLAARRARQGRRRDTPRQDDRLRRARLARPPRRPARRRSVDGRGRLSGGAKLLDRLGARRHSRRAYGPEARGRRGFPLPDRRAPAGRQDRATRPDRRLLRLGTFRGRPAHARGRRIGHRATDGDDPD